MTLAASAVDEAGNTRQRWLALNDFVLHKGGFARVVRLSIAINGESIGIYAADGVIISTPTGSTAYSLSAGGPVVVPTLESIILTPVSAHAGVAPAGARPDAEVSGGEKMARRADGHGGRPGWYGPCAGRKLVLSVAPSAVLIVRFPGTSFFERMRAKLGWGGLPERVEPRQC